MGDSELECVQNVKASLCLFEKLGFVIHPEKYVLAPTHVITYLRSEINSADMTVTLMREKKEQSSKQLHPYLHCALVPFTSSPSSLQVSQV